MGRSDNVKEISKTVQGEKLISTIPDIKSAFLLLSKCLHGRDILEEAILR